jgi:hypothetical protein
VFARLARYAVDPERVGDAVESFRDAGRSLAGLTGFVNGFLLIDRDSGSLSTLTLWETGRALEESGPRAAALRVHAIERVDGSCESVAEYEVAAEFGAQPVG